jgi:glycosyltransferase involved in cell wall biosynthesis
MQDIQKNTNGTTNGSIRPALVVDRNTMNDYTEFLRRFLVGLADESYESALICPPDTGAANVLSPSVKLIYYPILKIPLLWVQNRKAVLGHLEKFKPTILHCFCPSRAHLTRYLARKLDIPYVFTFSSLCKKFLRPPVSSSHCGRLIASSNPITENLKATFDKFVDIVEQVNIGTFVEDTCACFCRPGRLTSLIVAGPLNNDIPFEPLLNAIRHLVIDGYEITLAIVGSGPAEKSIHELVKTLGISQAVTIVGDIQPLRNALAGADIFIQPRRTNEINFHLLEAMSVGMVVAACCDTIDDILIEDETAVCFDPHDELRVYSSLQKLLSNRQEARKIAMAGQDYLREHHSVSKNVAALINIYRSTQLWYKERKTQNTNGN